MNGMTRMAGFGAALFACWMLRPVVTDADTMTHATIAEVPLPQIAHSSQIIVTGKVVKVELQTVGPGIDRVICYVRVDGILKGRPLFVSTDVLGARVQTVPFGYEIGPNVPGDYWRHDIAEDGLWFMSAMPSSGTPGLPHRVDGSYFNVDRRDRANAEVVKGLLRRAGKPAGPTVVAADASRR